MAANPLWAVLLATTISTLGTDDGVDAGVVVFGVFVLDPGAVGEVVVVLGGIGLVDGAVLADVDVPVVDVPVVDVPVVKVVVSAAALDAVDPVFEAPFERECRVPTMRPTAKARTTRTTVVTGNRARRRRGVGGRACAMVWLVLPIYFGAMRAGPTMATMLMISLFRHQRTRRTSDVDSQPTRGALTLTSGPQSAQSLDQHGVSGEGRRVVDQ